MGTWEMHGWTGKVCELKTAATAAGAPGLMALFKKHGNWEVPKAHFKNCVHSCI